MSGFRRGSTSRFLFLRLDPNLAPLKAIEKRVSLAVNEDGNEDDHADDQRIDVRIRIEHDEAAAHGLDEHRAKHRPYELSRVAAKAMALRGEGGAIVHIASLNNAIGLEGVSVYGAHKAALCQLAKSMAVEWAQYKIRVNAICPGFMLTPLSKPLWDDPVRGGWILERSLLKRPGFPEELVGCLLLLISGAGSFITGQTMYVDGGWLAGTPWTSDGDAEPATVRWQALRPQWSDQSRTRRRR